MGSCPGTCIFIHVIGNCFSSTKKVANYGLHSSVCFCFTNFNNYMFLKIHERHVIGLYFLIFLYFHNFLLFSFNLPGKNPCHGNKRFHKETNTFHLEAELCGRAQVKTDKMVKSVAIDPCLVSIRQFSSQWHFSQAVRK